MRIDDQPLCDRSACDLFSARSGTASLFADGVFRPPNSKAFEKYFVGFLCLLPVALVARVRWPASADWLAAGLLGICFFAVFFILYNLALRYTTAVR